RAGRSSPTPTCRKTTGFSGTKVPPAPHQAAERLVANPGEHQPAGRFGLPCGGPARYRLDGAARLHLPAHTLDARRLEDGRLAEELDARGAGRGQHGPDDVADPAVVELPCSDDGRAVVGVLDTCIERSVGGSIHHDQYRNRGVLGNVLDRL